jgi:hypothetical protein
MGWLVAYHVTMERHWGGARKGFVCGGAEGGEAAAVWPYGGGTLCRGAVRRGSLKRKNRFGRGHFHVNSDSLLAWTLQPTSHSTCRGADRFVPIDPDRQQAHT